MINAIQYLKRAAENYRIMAASRANNANEGSADKNRELADEFEPAAEALRTLHNERFNEGVLAGLTSLADSCKARRAKAANTEIEGKAMALAQTQCEASGGSCIRGPGGVGHGKGEERRA